MPRQSSTSRVGWLAIILSLLQPIIADPSPTFLPQQVAPIVEHQASATVVVIATTVTASVQGSTVTVSTTSPASPQYTDPLTLKTSILNSTNFFRYEHSAAFLLWNDSLAEYASAYAAKCLWEHSHGAAGENLARGYPSVTTSVDAWGNERALYNFSGTQTGFTQATGHFTQLVWKSTQTVGCAAVNCNGTNGLDGYFLVCEYWPAGNIVQTNSNDANHYFEDNVSAQVNQGSGFNEASATMGATGVGTRQATGTAVPSSTASGKSQASSEKGDDGYGLRLCLMVMLVYACAFM